MKIETYERYINNHRSEIDSLNEMIAKTTDADIIRKLRLKIEDRKHQIAIWEDEIRAQLDSVSR